MQQTATSKIRTVFRIRDWNRYFELNRSREIRVLEWVPCSNRMADLSYIQLMAHQNGASYFGVWHALVYIASRCTPRGTLRKDTGESLQIAELAAVARIPEALIVEAVPRFIEIGWLEEIAIAEPAQIERKANGHALADGSIAPAIVTPFDDWWKLWIAGTHQSSNRDGAQKEFNLYVNAKSLKAAMVCTQDFMTSDRTVRGIGIPNPENWIRKNAKDNWTARWPKPKPSRGERVEENLRRMHE